MFYILSAGLAKGSVFVASGEDAFFFSGITVVEVFEQGTTLP